MTFKFISDYRFKKSSLGKKHTFMTFEFKKSSLSPTTLFFKAYFWETEIKKHTFMTFEFISDYRFKPWLVLSPTTLFFKDFF
jgi:hypothetical protein